MKIIDQCALIENIVKNNENVFIYLGGHHFSQDRFDDAEKNVERIDPSANCYWVWQGTEFDDTDISSEQELYRQGPLLVQIRGTGLEKMSLLDHFLNVWGHEQKGLILTSLYSANELKTHLQSILWVQGENEADKYLINLQNPEKQNLWLHSFSKEQLQHFMGPISSITWQDICGYEMKWLFQINEQPKLTPQNVGWCKFDNEQYIRFKKLEQDYLLREITSHICFQYPKKKQFEARELAQRTIEQAQAKGILDQPSILLLLKAQFYIFNKAAYEDIIDLLANQSMPLDVRIQITEQRVRQAEQKKLMPRV